MQTIINQGQCHVRVICVHMSVCVCLMCLAQDKGGPSKGGLLNSILLLYTVTYVCNEINGMCINNRLMIQENK